MAAAVDHDDQDEERLMMFSLAHQCRWWLRNFSRHLGNSAAWQQHLSTIDDSQGRFSVWANNIGALRDPKSSSSLDYRLRDGGPMRNSIAAGALPNRTDEASEIFENADGDDGFPVTTELDELLSGIQSSVDRLFRLSMLIRRKRPQGRLPTEIGAQVVDATMDIRHIKDKFPKVREAEWLAERLGTAIAKRREFLCYRQLHRQRLAEQSQYQSGEVTAASRRAPSTIATTYDESSLDIDQETIKPAHLSIITGATSFATAFEADEDDNLHVPTFTRLKFHGTQFQYDSAFECPFCRTIQVVSSELNQNRRHVFADLQPYICTSENCTLGPFPSRHEWFNHELESHRKQWHCTKCRDSRFTSTSRLREHFDSSHRGAFNDTQWPFILKACERSLGTFKPHSCPFCFSWDPPENEAYNIQEFGRHLGSHLQQLALTALPIAIDGLAFLEETVEEVYEIIEPGAVWGRYVQYATVPLSSSSEVNLGPDTYYSLQVMFNDGEAWWLRRTSRELYNLHMKLLELFPPQAGNIRVPPTFPYMPGLEVPGSVPNIDTLYSNSKLRRDPLDRELDVYIRNLITRPMPISWSNLVLEFFTPRLTDGNIDNQMLVGQWAQE
ncbi:uncharacterized protein NECHADRAFT_84262 [Fusarium vanettenii 77-13-4]|uniref:PX domain-containing protein n=1 Tax=Fusarium vanettenii (strain ATCC MYA-4622 / CBS 123669 / FGSC 9596 / NRRL 45880 / 77-13-4) TaxID=660122 RepID=C7Z059_FUSV7|nr:uncharacterized protein NECHADRAFT_84262 [Fusarium vanettenii 77-13-4]EEU42727.1 hypothetical protein NECHADRAFT_84262 [Fusarium vanettenii 77-13-4]